MKTISLAILVTLIGIVGFTLFGTKPEQPNFGATVVGNDYRGTTTRAYNGATVPNLSVLKYGSGSLGSITITGAGAGVVNFYDATSTVTNSEWATTTIMSIPANAAAGTYVIDREFTKGLLIEIIGAAPTSSVSWR